MNEPPPPISDPAAAAAAAEQLVAFFESLTGEAKREYQALADLDRRYGEDSELEDRERNQS